MCSFLKMGPAPEKGCRGFMLKGNLVVLSLWSELFAFCRFAPKPFGCQQRRETNFTTATVTMQLLRPGVPAIAP